jgi:predicted nucleic acid-binding protein
MRVFFDSSAFVKRYIREAGSDAVLQWCDQATEITLSGIALPELVSTFCRLHREGKINATQYRQLKSILLADIEDAAICDLTPMVLAHAISSLEGNVLRGMDAIHIGSALALKADIFISSDKRQLDAAARSGLRIGAV